MPTSPTERPSVVRFTTGLAMMLAVAVALGVVTAGLAIPFAGVLGFGARDVARNMENLPSEFDEGSLSQRSRILDANGKTIATLYDENRVIVPLSQVSRTMTEAIVAIEDYRFYQHGALDIKGTVRALVTNQAQNGRVQGGSSITQQLVKQTLVQTATTEEGAAEATDDTYARKLRELRYAVAVEKEHSKDWILERYLNTVYFGDGAWGIQSAARHYFNVKAKNLDLAQSALLAGMVRNPTGYDPTNYPDRALERRSIVLNRMAQLGVVTQAEADQADGSGLTLRLRSVQNGCLNSDAPFFCDYVVSTLLKDPSLGNNAAARQDLITNGGLVIKTTVDLAQQGAADASVSAQVFPTDEAIGALALIEPGSGNVKALAQSRPMGTDKEAGQTFLNYVVPQEYGDSAGFQGGSTFKAFVLASAINQGIPLSTTFDAKPEMTFAQGDYANCPDAGNFVGEFPVGNSTSSGVMDVYRGTRESVNTFYAQLERETGVCAPFELAKAMGVNLDNPEGTGPGKLGAERVPSFTLGVPSVSPLEMAEAYSTFAARGLHCAARPVTEIADLKGNVLKSYDPQCTQVMPQSTADAVNDVLRGVIEPGGFGAALALDQPAAGKTGTTNSQFTVWFSGYTPNLAGAAMIAGANIEGTPISLQYQTVGGSYVGEASGSGFAGPIWGNAMQAIDDSLDYVDFVPPSSTDVAGVQVPVPDTDGISIADAQAAIEAGGFVFAYGGRDDARRGERGTVAYSYPSAGAGAQAGTTVTVYESRGRSGRG
ncbi:MAG: penicillin-binding protein [Nocardioides sp.]|nr:penicillin-binding protein [Nocardioides sp.]